MRTMMILKGLPGCGKSTEARKILKKESPRWKRVNRDDLRAMLDDSEFSRDNEEFVLEMQEQVIRRAFQDGYDVIVDNTNLVGQTIKKLHKLAESVGDVKVIEKGFNETVETCLKRNAQREGRARVPEDVINKMARSAGIDRGKKLEDKEEYYPPRDNAAPGNPYEADEKLPRAILCDLDGTLAKIGDRSPYDASQCDIKDHPNWPVIQTVLAMHAQGVNIIFMSGRDSRYREPTIRFIEQWCRVENLNDLNHETAAVPAVSELIPYQLHMRGTGDMRKDSLVKSDLFDEHVRGKYNVLFALDDRNQVVDLWRSLGLTCFQVAEGNF